MYNILYILYGIQAIRCEDQGTIYKSKNGQVRNKIQ